MARGLVIKFLFLAFILMFSEAALAYSTRSRLTAIRADIDGGIKMVLNRFEIDCGRYPTTSEGFAALVNCPTNISSGRWHGPYLDSVPFDTFGNAYVYRCPGIHNTNGYDLYSCGSDGISKSGGADLDDVNNWDPNSPHGGAGIDLDPGEWLAQKLRNSLESPIVAVMLILIPLCFAARIIASIFSQRVRDLIARHPTAHLVWMLASVAALFLILLSAIPRIV